jgi:hypothetical protein
VAEHPDLVSLYERLYQVLRETDASASELTEALRQSQRLIERSDVLLRQAQPDSAGMPPGRLKLYQDRKPYRE